LFELAKFQSGFRKTFGLVLTISFALYIAAFYAKAIRNWPLMVVMLALSLVITFRLVAVVGRIDKRRTELGLQCPNCRLPFRGTFLRHLLATGRCMKCNQTIFPT
jgi:predicted neutral ceramidase superfamily lipid hydrolase